MRFCLLFIGLTVTIQSNAQFSHSLFLVDTLKIDSRIGGSLDSIDKSLSFQSTTLSGGGWGNYENTLSLNFLNQFPGGQRFYSMAPWKKMRYSGLPHIGFGYSFGGQASQQISATYEQVFKGNYILNLDFSKNKSNGFLRNNDYSHNNLQLQLNKTGKIFSFELKGLYESSNVTQSNGLLSDTLANDFSLVFLPVKKENASTKTQRLHVYESNYLDFNKDSINALGLYSSHDLQIKNYKYAEIDTLQGLYNLINYDSTTTQDQHQWSQIANGAGLFFKSKNNFVKTGLNLNYWNFQNLGRFNDTVEVAFVTDYHFASKRVEINDKFELNLVGAQNGFSNQLNSEAKLNFATLKFSGNYENKLADYYIRYAKGNNYNPANNPYNKQTRINANLAIQKEIRNLQISGSYSFSLMKNNYYFIFNEWRNDTLSNLAFHQISLKLEYRLKSFYFQPTYNFTISPNNFGVIPQHQLYSRIYLKGGIFKAKKLKGYVGVDVSLQSSFQRIGFTPVTSTLDFSSISSSSAGYLNLHAFAGLQIDEFKFFVKMQNIGYAWNNRNTLLMQSFPLASYQFQVGITWDFFN